MAAISFKSLLRTLALSGIASLLCGLNAVQAGSLPAISAIRAYSDQDYGFTVAIPEGWQRIVAMESPEQTQELEPGYAVGFESGRSSPADNFADYVMIEILPGAETGAFETSGKYTGTRMVDGNIAITDQLVLDSVSFDLETLELTVFQAEIFALGYTIGVYAVGKSDEKEILADVFELVLRTLSVPEDPFSVS